MNDKTYKKIWELAMPYLQQGTMKDFVVHTNNVVKAMELLISGEGGEENILIPAAILHDVGFSKVAKDLQTNAEMSKKREAQRQHLVFAKEIIEEILNRIGYNRRDITKVIDIVSAHKFSDPKELDKRMLIDADNLSDTFKDQFVADAKSYGCSFKQLYKYRTENKYYTQTAQKIADENMKQRHKEISDK